MKRRQGSGTTGRSRWRGGRKDRLETIASQIDSNRSSFVGRQAIFDRDLEVIGYELLLRDGPIADLWVEDDPDLGVARLVVNTFIDLELGAIIGSKPAYLNVTTRAVRDGLPAALQPQQVAVIVNPTDSPDAKTLQAVAKLRTEGYQIVLSVGTDDLHVEPLLRAADAVKVKAGSVTALQGQMAAAKQAGAILMADRVASYQELARMRQLGFDMFQGTFLSRPAVLRQRKIPKGHRAALELVAQLQNPDADIRDLADIIRRDVTLSYRILRLVNSAFYSQPQPIESIEGAIMLLGTRQIGAWVGLIKMAEISRKPSELTTIAAVRASVCEAIATRLGRSDASSFYTAGLFSTLDALLDTSIERAVEGLPLTTPIVDALTDRTGVIGDVLGGVVAFETGDWDNAKIEGIGDPLIAAIFRNAIVKVDEMWAHIDEPGSSRGILG